MAVIADIAVNRIGAVSNKIGLLAEVRVVQLGYLNEITEQTAGLSQAIRDVSLTTNAEMNRKKEEQYTNRIAVHRLPVTPAHFSGSLPTDQAGQQTLRSAIALASMPQHNGRPAFHARRKGKLLGFTLPQVRASSWLP